jgi:hypothetical protein
VRRSFDWKEATREGITAMLTSGFGGGGVAQFQRLREEGNGMVKGETTSWRGFL